MAKVSPVDASAAYLAHLRDAWNARIAGKTAADRLEKQDVLLTVPASFDAVARELTVEAAGKAGLEQVTLLEEPQAAFYAWLAAQGDHWRKQVKVGDIILVCDVGGGTTDFTLIAVTDEGGDLALLAPGRRRAHPARRRQHGPGPGLRRRRHAAPGHGRPRRRPSASLWATPAGPPRRRSSPSPRRTSAPVAVLGRGSKVIGGSIKTELTRETAQRGPARRLLPRCAPTDLPARGRRVGLTEIGLPYAADPAITRHLARFLGQQAGSLHTGGLDRSRPSAVLFNGGVFKADRAARPRARRPRRLGRPARARAADRPTSTSPSPAAPPITAWSAAARASGSAAAWPGRTTSASRPPRPAVPGVAPPIKALCVVPMGMEEGTETDVPGPEFGLVVGEPAEFRFLGSTTRRDDPVGTILDRWAPDEIQELAPLETALAAEDGGRGRDRPGPAPLPRHRGRHARALVPEHPRRPSLEARIQRAGALSRLIRGSRFSS